MKKVNIPENSMLTREEKKFIASLPTKAQRIASTQKIWILDDNEIHILGLDNDKPREFFRLS